MKLLAAAAIFLIGISTSFAEPDMWVLNNENGTSIVLVDTPCIVNGKPFYSVRSAVALDVETPGKKRGHTDGCWVFEGQLVFIQLNGGADGYIPRNKFIPLPGRNK
jgi:hypothetical protein